MNAPVHFDGALIREGENCWLPDRYYREDEWVSRSELYRLADSVAVFLCPEPFEARFLGESLGNKPAAMGTLVHLGVLEPGLYRSKVIPYAKTVRRVASDDQDADAEPSDEQIDAEPAEQEPAPQKPLTKAEIAAQKKAAAEAKRDKSKRDKALKAEQAQAKKDLLYLAHEHDLWLVPPGDIDTADAMIDAVWAHPRAASYLSGNAKVRGQECTCVWSEVAITWTDKATGVKCRALLDRVLEYPDFVVVVDLKTDRNTPSPERWADRAASEWLYEQADFYLRGGELAFRKPALFVWVVVRNDKPYIAGVQRPRKAELDVAARVNNALLARLASLQGSDEWKDEWTETVVEAVPSGRGVATLRARAEAAERLASTA